VEAEIAGDPMGGTRLVRRSLRNLSRELRGLNHQACPTTVGRLLRKQGYSPKSNNKKITGPPHPDRDTQFKYIEAQKKAFMGAVLPVISVDTKKKELVGNFKNPGRIWCQKAEEVNVYDFQDDAVGHAVPYGIYDVNHNLGFVGIGKSHDTPKFAVDAISLWWKKQGQMLFPKADKLLILADAGGSNGCRPRSWKQQLQEQLADSVGVEVTVCHYPTGASKWNPIEHRLFAPISINWAGKPLRTFKLAADLIRNTKTQTGLKVKAALMRRHYDKGVKVTDQQFQALNLIPHDTCPQWNYSIKPHPTLTTYSA